MNLKSILLASGLMLLMTFGVRANNMLVQNVTTLGNDAVNKTIQVQFDISWDNSWRDAINYDAAWIFMKFKDANGLWQHVQLNPTGFVNGTGTANTVQVTNDKVGCWLYRSGLGSGTFNSTGMQLQWNYGLAGLTSVTGLEVRVFGVEMVYVPEGEFNCASLFNVTMGNITYGNSLAVNPNGAFKAPGEGLPVINTKISPTLTYAVQGSIQGGVTQDNLLLRIKGDAGIDSDMDGIIDNTLYPIGFKAFYSYKFEQSEQQFADFMNTLISSQISTIESAGSSISLSNNQYFSSAPNIATGNANPLRLLAFGDWSGLRPMSFLEFNKICYGPLQPVYFGGNCLNLCSPLLITYPAWGNASCPASFPFVGCSQLGLVPVLQNIGYNANSLSTRASAGSSYYGVMDLTWNAYEPLVKLSSLNFREVNGDGILTSNGLANVESWSEDMIIFIEHATRQHGLSRRGFRYVRSAE